MHTAIIAGITTFILTIIGIPAFIRFYQKARISGQQMHEDVKQHQAKAGTPTMGGTVFLLASIVASFVIALFSGNLSSNVTTILFILFLYGLVGFLDDFLKVFRRINEGLNPKQKLFLQLVGGVVFYLFFERHGGGDMLNVFGFPLELGFLYIFFVLFWLVGFSNAVNLTDGIDGLASISVVISLGAYAVIALEQKRFDLLIVIFSMIGGLLGFFGFNHKPAKIFMGDVGSLALGGMLAALSIALHQEWTLLLIGIVYVFETASVMLQVTYFKMTGGKRIFRMTPVHHHFELGGFSGRGKAWSEWKVDFLFWGIGLVASLITLAILYL
ncbi:phospho-N-acetylmuramoyl-pentapeptide-transferase [Streptococcus gordonii]|uniref:Phospho-N-acetylmuramoyl-pentapeptide-transferase n=1 Tax=Streptococcus gordonii (strain Challis / ATCC 35105 / BCRC 15272 / CH1 / DL1 / V288) TaxID=467705 RepID=MRAY_STRGC|nr:phospho-N-acetylmuramoyl-pentapeptide-transferase [Streptococcus gordonii]A8AVT2.1 RecName: Full=Phospho-N-acetylmuramoyl-pentapeptide-transferase; AltName: Full=UDP-MurNAc-pentapeptide phosphotransferase [Streptococcus gordonii str. Challis substr. CH1]ABV10526.1 phospho-N-acetylmuramoyl-pentapeptide-transferase [Streptococcus gordonii str. Challis substr. CH1]MBZ2136756.1 phospho-N-acetylmuramoyl-pentapeptide-transferase [Streptococcus gordonii]QGS44921.1 phospho-N-acetylmuramoyl-pentapept